MSFMNLIKNLIILLFAEMSENTNSFPSSPHNIFIKERKSDIIHRGDNPKNN